MRGRMMSVTRELAHAVKEAASLACCECKDGNSADKCIHEPNRHFQHIVSKCKVGEAAPGKRCACAHALFRIP